MKENSVADLFATVCVALMDSLSASPTEQELSDQISDWVRLFWRLGQRVETDILGFAGELVVLSVSGNIEKWIEAWHAQANEILDFDFVASAVSVEVKATRSNLRRHSVSLDQILAPGLQSRYFASIQIVLNDSGELLSDVVRGISDRLDTEHRRSFWGVLTTTCGTALDEVLSRRIDLAQAAQSIQFYYGTSIPVPSVDYPLADGVSAVKFTSDFTKGTQLTAQELDAIVNSPIQTG